MNIRKSITYLGAGVVLVQVWTALPAFGQTPVIVKFDPDGELVAANLSPGTTASMAWSPSVLGPWTKPMPGVSTVVDSAGVGRFAVPSNLSAAGFYRVEGIPARIAPGMVPIPAGAFTMGDSFYHGLPDEFPLHTVQVSAFYMDPYEVTEGLWDDVYLWAVRRGYDFDNPGSWLDGVEYGGAPNHPVHTISWYDAVKWCNARSEREGRVPAYYLSEAHTTVYRTGQVDLQNDWVKWHAGYRLPTEAEWEKAARGGASGTRFPWSDSNLITHSRANYRSFVSSVFTYDVSPTRGYHPTFVQNVVPPVCTNPVGYFAPNGYGLYDMAGNVLEWCWDWYGGYPSEPQSDPRGPTSGTVRVDRGGSWSYGSGECRVMCRSAYPPVELYAGNLGFRCVSSPDP